jgi:hypothetical protein
VVPQDGQLQERRRASEAIAVARNVTDEDIRRAGELADCPGEAEAEVKTVRKYR